MTSVQSVSAQTVPDFEDVPDGHIAEPAIEWAAENGITMGVGNNRFGLGQTLTRYEMVTFLCRAFNPGICRGGTKGSDRFDDVPEDHWANYSIGWAADRQITSGVSATEFGGSQTLNREQMITFLYRAEGKPTGGSLGSDIYEDVPDDHSQWANLPMGWAFDQGISAGIAQGTFGFGTNLSREEMALFLCRALAPGTCPPSQQPLPSSVVTTITATDQPVSVEPLGGPPSSLGLDSFYAKYLDTGGLPIVSSSAVPDEALYRARDIIEDMLSGRADLIASLAKSGVRVVIMARSTVSSDLPEFPVDAFWDQRTVGGGFFADPMVVIAEENLLCYENDLFPSEDITVHEFAHAVHLVGLEKRRGGTSFGNSLVSAFDAAQETGLWQNTYASTNYAEYFAEGVQSWFGVNDPPGPVHNDVNTRSELQAYDPVLASLIEDVFGEADLTSSCHETFHDGTTPDGQSTTLIQGVVTGPTGQEITGTLIWAWSGNREDSRWGWTDSTGAFAIRAPNGSYTLDVYAAPGGLCAGWYDGDSGITTDRNQAKRLTVEGIALENLVIRLPNPPTETPAIQC